jgi:hypothetical protein
LIRVPARVTHPFSNTTADTPSRFLHFDSYGLGVGGAAADLALARCSTDLRAK